MWIYFHCRIVTFLDMNESDFIERGAELAPVYWFFMDAGYIKPRGEFATMHTECSEIIAILEKVVRYARYVKAKEAREEEPPKRRKRHIRPEEEASRP